MLSKGAPYFLKFAVIIFVIWALRKELLEVSLAHGWDERGDYIDVSLNLDLNFYFHLVHHMGLVCKKIKYTSSVSK
jgi:hypothetical protein